MNFRSFLIPSGAVGLALLPGCTTIVGDWDLTGWTIDGTSIDLDYNYQGYEITTTGSLSIDPDLTGEWDIAIAIDGATYTEVYGDATAEKVDGRTYDLTLSADGDDLTLECTFEDTTMTCDGRTTDGTSEVLEWEPAE